MFLLLYGIYVLAVGQRKKETNKHTKGCFSYDNPNCKSLTSLYFAYRFS
jgi:hypothetical protein